VSYFGGERERKSPLGEKKKNSEREKEQRIREKHVQKKFSISFCSDIN
jgi:hypothetical protein